MGIIITNSRGKHLTVPETADIPGFLKKHREAFGMTLQAVGEIVGVSRQAVYHWETGDSVPTNDNLFALVRYFGDGRRKRA